VSAVADKLREARALIERGWTQEAYSRSDDGRDALFSDAEAVCWCAVGAMAEVGLASLCEMYFRRVIDWPGGIISWNDAPERTQAEVLAAFDKAIELAEDDQ
jgi:rhodanese-related sulfurtransferase